MSARMPSRRLGQSALAAFRPATTRLTPLTAVRHISNPFGQSSKELPDLSNPILERYLEKQQRREADKSRPEVIEGSLAKTTIFDPSDEVPGAYPGMATKDPEGFARLQNLDKRRREQVKADKERRLTALKLDPDPQGRKQLERKLVLQGLKRRGRLTKEVALARTERESVYKSPFLPTSTKKLTRVMHQIAGKTVEEALIQLRFSKKKVARDVMKGLELARDEAIVARGMGLGNADGEAAAKEVWERARLEGKTPDEIEQQPYLPDGTRVRPTVRKPVLIELKNGTKKWVYNPSDMYIDQAWVGKGEFGKSLEFRARGRINVLMHRTTSFSVLLKEEKTRMRLSDEIKKKRDNRKLWQPLPDRPVTSQRQFCLW